MKKVVQIKSVDDLDFANFEKGKIHHAYVHIPGNSMGLPWKIPLIIARGHHDGPTLGITAAVHGNELNGLSTIFKLFKQLDINSLKGNLISVPICNVPGYLRNQRYFSDGQDLNRCMPGKLAAKKPSEFYNYYLTHKIIKHFNYLLDLHTASSGKVNSLYIRADLDDPICKQLAYYQNPHIIVKKYDEEGTLRAWANTQGIKSITIEIGNPNTFQHELIDDTLEGILNTMKGLKMIEGEPVNYLYNTYICQSSHWLFSKSGGIIDVLPHLAQEIKKDELIANIYNVFGELQDQIFADVDGVVIGKNISPACEAGSRILHLGVK